MAEDKPYVLGDVGEDLFVAAVLGAVVDVLNAVVADGAASGLAEELHTGPGDGQGHLRENCLGLVHGLKVVCVGGGGREGESLINSNTRMNGYEVRCRNGSPIMAILKVLLLWIS